MRVLHVVAGLIPASGGPVVALTGLSCAQAAAGCEVTVFATQRDHRPVAEAQTMTDAGVQIEAVGPCPGPLVRHPDIAPRLHRLARDHDIVHAHGVWEEVQYQAFLAARFAGIPFIIRPCGLLDEWSLRRKSLKKRLYRLWRLNRILADADAIHCSTAMEAESTARVCGMTPIIVEPNGIELSEFRNLPRPGRMRERFNFGDRPVVLFLGRIHPGKGLEYLVPALASMQSRNAIVAVVGPDSGGYQEVIAKTAQERGVSSRVHFLGPLAGMAKVEALVDADVLALPSEHENFGNVVVEALAARCPVVVSNHVGAGADVASRQVGSVVPLIPEAIASALDSWLANSDRRHAAGEAGRAFVFERFDWARIAASWREHYLDIGCARSPAKA